MAWERRCSRTGSVELSTLRQPPGQGRQHLPSQEVAQGPLGILRTNCFPTPNSTAGTNTETGLVLAGASGLPCRSSWAALDQAFGRCGSASPLGSSAFTPLIRSGRALSWRGQSAFLGVAFGVLQAAGAGLSSGDAATGCSPGPARDKGRSCRPVACPSLL